MSDIFYTEVDKNLKTELLSRGVAGRYNRTTKDINYMVSKIANVQITPFHVEYKDKASVKDKDEVLEKTVIQSAILGGYNVRTGEYLPSGPQGFLQDKSYKII